MSDVNANPHWVPESLWPKPPTGLLILLSSIHLPNSWSLISDVLDVTLCWLSRLSLGFLSLGTTDIREQVIHCAGGHSVHWRVFSSIPGKKHGSPVLCREHELTLLNVTSGLPDLRPCLPARQARFLSSPSPSLLSEARGIQENVLPQRTLL